MLKASSESSMVSIIVPMYNLETYIESSIESLLTQSYKNIEILAIDDDSSDKTVEKVISLVAKDNRIRLLRNRHRSGASGARNTGIEQANGDWIAFLDGDDLLHRDSVFFRMESAIRNPSTPFLSGDFFHFHEEPADAYNLESEFDPFWRLHLNKERNSFGEVLINTPIEKFLTRHLTWTGSAFIRRDLMRQLGGFEEALPRSEDVHLWLRAAAHSQSFIFVSKSISYYRQRPGSLSTTNLAPDQYAVAAFRSLRFDPAFKEYEKNLNRCICDHIHKNTYHYRKQKMMVPALRSSIDGVISDPFRGFAWKNLIGSALRL